MPDAAKTETLVDVHRSLPPEVQKYLSEQTTSETHHALLENMRSMTRDERTAYSRSIMPAPVPAADILYKSPKES